MTGRRNSAYSYGKGRAVLAALALVIIITGLAIATDLSQNSPQFCSQCHTMKPQYYTWQASSHSRMDCTDCHRAEGIRGAYQFAKDLARWTYAEVTDSYILPIRLFRGIDDETCFRCHGFNRETSASGDVIIPHTQHTDKRVRCVSCHSAIAHGDIARRAVTRKIPSEAWDKDTGLQEMARELVDPDKEACIACHYRRRVSNECATCHADIKEPENHRLPDFATNHGPFAREALPDCNFCHGFVGAKRLPITDKTTVMEYSRQNNFCLSCHRQRPASHTPDFRDTHRRGIDAGLETREDCLVCHDSNPDDALPKATTVSCSSCHPSRKRNPLWRSFHWPPLAPGEGLSPSCMACHSAEQCLSCHYLPEYEPGAGLAPALDEFMNETPPTWQQ